MLYTESYGRRSTKHNYYPLKLSDTVSLLFYFNNETKYSNDPFSSAAELKLIQCRFLFKNNIAIRITARERKTRKIERETRENCEQKRGKTFRQNIFREKIRLFTVYFRFTPWVNWNFLSDLSFPNPEKSFCNYLALRWKIDIDLFW